MALNPNHTFEDLGDVKCAIVEKNCTPGRSDFLRDILSFNGYAVVVVKSPPPKAAKPAPPKPAADGSATEVAPPAAEQAAPAAPDTYTVGVTDLTFSPVNAVLNRELKTPDGDVLTVAYWKQKETKAQPDEWYWLK